MGVLGRGARLSASLAVRQVRCLPGLSTAAACLPAVFDVRLDGRSAVREGHLAFIYLASE